MPTSRRGKLWVVSVALALLVGVVGAVSGCDQTGYGAMEQGKSCNVNVPKPSFENAALTGGIVYKAYAICAITPISATLHIALYYATYEYPKHFYLDDEDGSYAIPAVDPSTTPAYVHVSMICRAGDSYKVVVTASATYPPGAKAKSAVLTHHEGPAPPRWAVPWL